MNRNPMFPGGMPNPMAMMQNNPLMMLMQSGNPMQMLQNMAAQNPAIQQVMPLVQGKNTQQLKETAQNIANERGIDLNAFAGQLQSMFPRR